MQPERRKAVRVSNPNCFWLNPVRVLVLPTRGKLTRLSERAVGHFRTGVLRQRTEELVVAELLDDVLAPTDDAAGAERRGVECARDADVLESDGGQNSTFTRRARTGLPVVRALASALPLRAARISSSTLRAKRDALGVLLLGDATQAKRARVVGAIDAVTEAHDAAPGRELCLGPGGCILRRADRIQHIENRTRRTAVQRSRKRADGGRDGSADISAGRRRDATGERGSVQSVVDGENQVRLDSAQVVGGRTLAGDAPEITLSIAQVFGLAHGDLAGVDDFHNRRRQCLKLKHFGFDFLDVTVQPGLEAAVTGNRRDGGAESGERLGAASFLDQSDFGAGQLAQSLDLGAESSKFFCSRKATFVQKEPDFFDRLGLSERNGVMTGEDQSAAAPSTWLKRVAQAMTPSSPAAKVVVGVFMFLLLGSFSNGETAIGQPGYTAVFLRLLIDRFTSPLKKSSLVQTQAAVAVMLVSGKERLDWVR